MKGDTKSPWSIYLFYCLVIGVFFLLSQNVLILKNIWPNLAISAPSLRELLFEESKPDYVALEDVIALSEIDTSMQIEEVDTSQLAEEPEPEEPKEKPRQLLTYNEFPKELGDFFEQLNQLSNGEKKLVRIMHLGDSQIELDRISSYVRNKLQYRFGGYGVGFVPLYNPLITGGRIKNEGTWHRYTNYGNEKNPELGSLGAWQSFTSFSPYPIIDSLWTDTLQFEGSLAYTGYKELYNLAKSFSQLKLYYELPKGKAQLSFTVNDSTITDSLVSDSGKLQTFAWKTNEKVKDFSMKLSGNQSPKFFGLSLEPDKGIVLDNVAMRGSSGTFFHKNRGGTTTQMLSSLNPSLIILEYGGNVMPYIKDSAKCDYYAKSIASQLRIVKSLCPKAAIIFIGPADMSYKNDLYYESYPLLEYVRDVLKQVAHDNGCAYWDMFEAMGGKNSMPSWVSAEPPLAGNDYTHFTPKGAALIAELFYYALETEYHNYNTNKELP